MIKTYDFYINLRLQKHDEKQRKPCIFFIPLTVLIEKDVYAMNNFNIERIICYNQLKCYFQAKIKML